MHKVALEKVQVTTSEVPPSAASESRSSIFSQPCPREEDAHEPMSILCLFRFTSPSDIPVLAFSTAAICIASVALPLQTWIYGTIFTKLTQFYVHGNFDEFIGDIRMPVGWIMIIGVAHSAIRWAGIYSWMIFGERQANRCRSKVYYTLTQVHTTKWFDTEPNLMGSLAQLNRCIEELREGSSGTLGLVVETLATIIALFCMAMVQSWALTLVVLGTLPAMAVLGWFFGGKTRMGANLENAASALCSKILDWNLVNNRTTKVCNARLHELVKFNRVVTESARAYYKLSNAVSANSGILITLSLLMFVQGFWFGNYMISCNRLSVSQVFTCFTACLALGGRISSVTSLFAILNKSYAAIERIETFLAEDHHPTPKLRVTGIIPPTPARGQIEFNNVNFAYIGRGPVLHNITMCIRPQEFNFVVGTSGSGKSTLAQLMVRLYWPSMDGGRMSLDGYNYETLSTHWLANGVMYLQQSSAIFNGTLKHNLTIGLENDMVTEAAVDAACSFALLSVTVADLKNGLDTVISESTLSGGQRQRVALARAYIRNPPVLILDEALSALSVFARQQLMTSIRDWRQNKTTIVITHDLSQINDRDYVFVMNQGKLVNEGPFEDLRSDKLISQFHDAGTISHELETKESLPDPFQDSGPLYLTDPVILQGLENDADREPDLEHLKSTFFILNYCRKSIPNKPLLALGLAISVAESVLAPVFSFLFSKLLSQMVGLSIGKGNLHELAKWSGVVIAIAVLTGLAHYSSTLILAILSEDWVVNLRKEAFAKLLEQDSAYYDRDTTRTSELTALIMNDTRDLRTLVADTISIAIKMVILVLMGTIWSFVTGWKLAFVGLACVVAMLLLSFLFSCIVQSSEHRYKNSIVELETHVHDTISNYKSIVTLNIMGSFGETFEAKLKGVKHFGHIRGLQVGLGLSISNLFVALATGTFLYYGMLLAGHHEYSYSRLLQVVTLLTFTMMQVGGLASQIPDIARGRRAGTYIIKILELPECETETQGGCKPFRRIDHVDHRVPLIAFRNVTFAYPTSPNKLILQGANIEVMQGEIVAITGESGSGKSTIGVLIERLYALSAAGKIEIRGLNIDALDVEWLRSFVAYVPQTASFFEGTIYDNLIYGLGPHQVNAANIESALKKTYIFDFVNSLDLGLKTQIGEGTSAKMSGGQLQRLSIARALLRKPQILILDECTAALDVESARHIGNLIKTELNDGVLTTLVITHSYEMVSCCSRECRVKDGKIYNT
ncbi:Alpha-factor-transporting ATPase [[Candida] zeylanoides]